VKGIMLTAGMLLFVVGVGGQTRTFSYELYNCKYRGTYDAKRFTPKQLRDTVKLIDNVAAPLATNATPFKLADVDRLDITKLQAEYGRARFELMALQIIPAPYFQQLKQRRLAALERMYQLSRASMLAYKTPASLAAINWAPECTTKFAQPLINGGDELLALWLDVNMRSRTNNGSPERVRRTYEEQYASPDRMRYAQLEVMAFGWWNCANEKIDYADDAEKQQKELEKALKSVKQLDCYDAP